jgi:pilus assembly protein CpaB
MNFRKLAVAFAIALVVSGLCTLSLGRRITASAAEHRPAHRYVVPVRPLQADEVLKADSLTVIDWPGEEVQGAFTKPQDAVGRTLLYPLEKGQLLTDKVVSAPGAGAGLAGKIPYGMRAIALRTDEVIGVAGFLVPGCHVDVLATYHSDRSPEPLTVTVLQNVAVIAVGHQLDPESDSKAAATTDVTLLLSPGDARKAVMASTQGTIHFVMRSGADTQTGKSEPVELSTLTGDALPLAAQAQKPAATTPRPATHAGEHKPPSHVFTVQTILGDKEVTNTFQIGTP